MGIVLNMDVGPTRGTPRIGLHRQIPGHKGRGSVVCLVRDRGNEQNKFGGIRIEVSKEGRASRRIR